MDYAVFAACTRSASINLFWRAQATYTLRLLWRQADLNRKAGSHWRWRRSRSRESASEPCQEKNQNRSRKWSHKLDGIWVERITMVSFLTIPLRLRCLRSSEISIGGIASRSRGTNQFQTIQFSLHRRRQSCKQYRYFSSDSDNFQQIVSLCSSDLVSDSGLIVSENWLYKR